MPAARREKRRRKHSFGGCRTCRRRHVKCDQIKPHCLACRSLNLVCDGYDSDLRWMPSATLVSAGEGQIEDESGALNTTRHHLFPMALRASMSASLRECLGSSSVDVSLAKLEAQTQNLEANEGVVSFGPFGVLRMGSVPSEAIQTVYTTSDDMSSQGQLTESSKKASDSGATLCFKNLDASMLGLGKTLQWPDLFTLELNTGHSLRAPQDATISHWGPETIMLDSETMLSNGVGDAQEGAVASFSYTDSAEELVDDRRTIALTEVESVAEAQVLLKYFHDSAVSLMTPILPNSENFWIKLQLAEAVRVLSDLSYLRTGTITHASAANLYGTLACSAYHFSTSALTQTTYKPEYWMNLFTRLKDQASAHMQLSVRKEQNSPRKSSYKDQLMAFLSLVACNTISGNYTAARRYISDTERLIQLKGLRRQRMSKDCRYLHQIYTWIRIVGESTFVTMDHAHYGSITADVGMGYCVEQTVAATFPSDTQNACLDEFFRQNVHGSDDDTDEEEPMEPDSYFENIHHNHPPQHHPAPPQKIYGISETWLSLVSQTTRLANIQDAANSVQATDPQLLDLLQKRASNLEQYIYDWISNDSDEVLRQSHPANRHMLQAMNSALIILFYRRVRNVDVSRLQRHVDSVLAALLKFDAALASEGLVGPGSPWPAFVAGCEAADHRNRTLLMTWLDRGFDKSGLKPFDTALGVMREVWDRRDGKVKVGSSGRGETAGSPSCQHTWVSVCREKGLWVPLY